MSKVTDKVSFFFGSHKLQTFDEHNTSEELSSSCKE